MSPRILLLSDIFPPKTGGSGRWFWEIYSRIPREHVLVAAGDDPRAAEFDHTHDLPITRLPLEMRTRGLRPFGNLKALSVARLATFDALLKTKGSQRFMLGALCPRDSSLILSSEHAGFHTSFTCMAKKSVFRRRAVS